MVEALEIKKPTNKYSKNILRSLVGNERAMSAFNSISMANIPTTKQSSLLDGKTISVEGNFLFTIVII